VSQEAYTRTGVVTVTFSTHPMVHPTGIEITNAEPPHQRWTIDRP
jgi:hypothetical protein